MPGVRFTAGIHRPVRRVVEGVKTTSPLARSATGSDHERVATSTSSKVDKV